MLISVNDDFDAGLGTAGVDGMLPWKQRETALDAQRFRDGFLGYWVAWIYTIYV